MNSPLRILILLPILMIFHSCSTEYGKVSYSQAPKVINVSAYDPKEKQRSGSSFTPLNQSALKANGSLALIARCGKGQDLDSKCSDFLVGAEQAGMMLGTYYFLLPSSNPHAVADQYIARLREIKRSRNLQTKKVLLAADIHTNCSAAQIVSFVKRIKKITGVTPVIYLENSDAIRRTLRNATSSQKRYLKKHPYWLALYSNNYNGLETPQKLTEASGIWDTWAMWQYGGVWWEHGRSQPHNYRGGSWKTPKYFGNLSQPTERNGFNGSRSAFYSFWNKHSWAW